MAPTSLHFLSLVLLLSGTAAQTCPEGSPKSAPGICGCDTADDDGDSDGTPACIDLCDADPFKTIPGTCGCGVADTDSDSDSIPDCNDACPEDPNKSEPGSEGCGLSDPPIDQGTNGGACPDNLNPGRTMSCYPSTSGITSSGSTVAEEDSVTWGLSSATLALQGTDFEVDGCNVVSSTGVGSCTFGPTSTRTALGESQTRTFSMVVEPTFGTGFGTREDHIADQTDLGGFSIQTIDAQTNVNVELTKPNTATCYCDYSLAATASAYALMAAITGTETWTIAEAEERREELTSTATVVVDQTVAYIWTVTVASSWTGNVIESDCRAHKKEGSYSDGQHVQLATGCTQPAQDVPIALEQETLASDDHMHRFRVKKFGFVGQDSLEITCNVRGVDESGHCDPLGRRLTQTTGRGLSEIDDGAARGLDWEPFTGKMTSDPVTVEVGDDPNLMRFGSNPEEKKKKEQPSQGQPNGSALVGISKPIQIRSHLSFSGMGAAWAVENKASIITALRSTLQLTAQEELVILSISAMSRRRKGRKLQGKGVQVNFGIGVSDPARAAAATSRVQVLSAGDSSALSSFIRTLNAELVSRRKPAAELSPSTLSFSAPEKNGKTASPQPQASQVAASFYEGPNEQAAPSPAASSPGGSGPLVGLAIGGLGVGLIFYMFKASKNRPVKGLPDGVQDAYASKVATVDGAEQAGEVGFGFDEA